MRRLTADDFWPRVQIADGDGCWTWKGERSTQGYGVFATFGLAHRYSWTLHVGSIPTGLFVCHRCDNPPCVRPDHLFLGTNADNIRDSAEKGRQFPTPAQRERMRESSARRWQRPEERQKASVSQIGIVRPPRQPHSEETKRKLSEARRGKPGHPSSAETNEKIRQAKVGKPRSEETKRKVAKSQRTLHERSPRPRNEQGQFTH